MRVEKFSFVTSVYAHFCKSKIVKFFGKVNDLRRS